jgi:hypothetical protein
MCLYIVRNMLATFCMYYPMQACSHRFKLIVIVTRLLCLYTLTAVTEPRFDGAKQLQQPNNTFTVYPTVPKRNMLSWILP